jgi:hypothetical protein
MVLGASCSSPPQPAYADISYQTRCLHADGSPIMAADGHCDSTGVERDIYGFNGDMGQHFSCTITEHGATRAVNFSVTAEEANGQHLGVSLTGAVVPAGGGALTGTAQFTWTDGNQYGGNAGAGAPSATQPCQVSGITFLTDTDTGLPRMDVNVACILASSIPAATPPVIASVTRPGNMGADATSPMTIHFYSCPVISR